MNIWKKRQSTSWFLVRLIGSLYALLAIAKFLTITGQYVGSLDQPDFVFKILTLRRLLLIGALAELALGIICFLNKKQWISWMCIASFSSALLCYRLVNLYYLGLVPCSCMGILTDIFHISMKTESILTLSFLLVCVPLSWIFVIYGRRIIPCESQVHTDADK